MKVKIKDIKIKTRIREDLGNINALVKSIEQYGLFNPILITQNYELLAGARRLKACEILEWKEIKVKIITISNDMQKLEIEGQENFLRKDFTEIELEKIIQAKRKLSKKSLFNILKYFFNLFKIFILNIKKLYKK